LINYGQRNENIKVRGIIGVHQALSVKEFPRVQTLKVLQTAEAEKFGFFRRVSAAHQANRLITKLNNGTRKILNDKLF
jgi:hypothetical protein